MSQYDILRYVSFLKEGVAHTIFKFLMVLHEKSVKSESCTDRVFINYRTIFLSFKIFWIRNKQTNFSKNNSSPMFTFVYMFVVNNFLSIPYTQGLNKNMRDAATIGVQVFTFAKALITSCYIRCIDIGIMSFT